MYIQYKTTLNGLIGKKTEYIPINNDFIYHIELHFDEYNETQNYLFIKFVLKTTEHTLEFAAAMTQPLLNSIIDLLVVQFNVPIEEPKVHAYQTKDKHVVATGLISIYAPQEYELTSSDYAWLTSEIISTKFSDKLKSNSYFQKYKSIILKEGTISRFLLLYSLLYEMKGNQKSVDSYIKEKEPEVQLIPSTKPSKQDETVYTWYRNQAEHMQTDTSITNIEKKCTELIGSLQLLVFNAVKESFDILS